MDGTGNRLGGAEAFVKLLAAHGVDTVFGLCGDTSLPLYDALARLGGPGGHGIRHILTRDERSAGYMADTYARLTGKVGICEGPSGGGATYILPAVAEANESSVAMIAITTDISVSSRGKFTLTELDQKSLFRPVTKWNTVIDRAVDIPASLRRAFREATGGRPGAVHLGLPYDVQKDAVDETDMWADPEHARYPARRVGPDPTDVEKAAKALAEARRPVIVVGGGVVISGAFAELAALAERLDAPVLTTISGQGAIADAHPLSAGVVGSNGGTLPTRALVGEADLVLFVGCRAGSVTTERWRFPAKGTPIVHVDIDPAVIGAIYPTKAAVVADAKLALGAIVAALGKGGTKSDANARVAKARAERKAAFEVLARSDDRPIKPERLVAEMAAVLPDDAVIVADPGTPCPYFSAFYPKRRTGRWFVTNRAHGALGYSLPAVIGAAIARPQSKCVAVMGDGSFGFACGEMETIARLGLPVTLVVVSNAVYGWIKAGQKSGYGQRYFSVDFNRTDHAAVAAAFGLKSWRVEDPAKLRSALSEAFAHDGPTLVDVVCQPLHEAKAPVSEWVA
ncbi:MAG: thiamine pyrophosphate-binding protein [Alphaproteobacteria bacterium]|nr:thiamine pyrophosphate-binding protein [Alphaproteobacteria bacterium]